MNYQQYAEIIKEKAPFYFYIIAPETVQKTVIMAKYKEGMIFHFLKKWGACVYGSLQAFRKGLYVHVQESCLQAVHEKLF